PDIGAAHESRHRAAQDAGAEHPHREHGRVSRGLGEGLVVVDGIEVARGPGIAHEVRARQLLRPHLGQGVAFLDVFPVAHGAQSFTTWPVSMPTCRARATTSPRWLVNSVSVTQNVMG